MVCCAIAGCSNHDRRQKELGFHFHCFPKDKEIRSKWINVCKRADSFSPDVARVCSHHFEESDYLRDLKSELLSLPLKKILKPDAVPHLLLPNQSSVKPTPICRSERTKRSEKRHYRKEAENVLRSSSKVMAVSENNEHEEESSVLTEVGNSISSINNSTGPSEMIFLVAENEKLKKLVEDLQVQLNAANEEISKLRHLSSVFKGNFSVNQQQALVQGRCIRWFGEDLAKAVTLRSLSYKALEYVRNVLKCPLPSETTIKRRLRQFSVSPGFIDLSIGILQAQATVLSNFERDVVLSFDEMKVDSNICFDVKQEIIRGPHNYVQVMVVRSMVGKWMQPLYYNFDTAVTVELLFEIIDVVEKSDFKVRAFVSDMNSSNRKLASDLNISWENPSIKNRFDENRNIWVFWDVPHALKLLRNHFLDDGCELECGNVVDKTAFERLIKMQSSGDLKFAHKISMHQILVAGSERQNVRKAAQLLSSTAGNAIIHNFPEFRHVGETVITVNNGFDVLNSRVPVYSTNCLKSAYGNSLVEQNKALDKFHELIRTMRVLDRKTGNKRSSLLPFQLGFLMSINSLRGLYKELIKEEYSYIMTARCNQDILESYFSKIRGLGRFYDHPLPTVVSQRIKTLLLSRNADTVINSENCQLDKDSPSLSSLLLSTNDFDNSLNVTVVSENEKKTEDLGFDIDSLLAQLDEENRTAGTVINSKKCLLDKDSPSLTVQLLSENDFENSLNVTVVSENGKNPGTEDGLNTDGGLGFDIDSLLARLDGENKTLTTLENVEENLEVVEMIAGYLAYRMRNKYPEKAHIYGNLTKNDAQSGKNWLQSISRGYLTKPSDECFSSVLKMEREFSKFHGQFVNKCPKVLETLKDIIKKAYPEIDDFLVTCFVRTRTFVRIKCLNVRRQEEQLIKRRAIKRRGGANERRTTKKMKKIVQ